MKSKVNKLFLTTLLLIIAVSFILYSFSHIQEYLQEKKSRDVVKEIKERLELKYNVVEARGICMSHFPSGAPSCDYAFIYYNKGEEPFFDGSVWHYGPESMQIHLTTEINESYTVTLNKLIDELPEGI